MECSSLFSVAAFFRCRLRFRFRFSHRPRLRGGAGVWYMYYKSFFLQYDTTNTVAKLGVSVPGYHGATTVWYPRGSPVVQ